MIPHFNVAGALNDLCALVSLALFIGAIAMWAS
jgi:hypothetical protein